MTLHERIAECLGWSVKDTQSFSLAALREMVAPKSSKLAYFITEEIRTGRHLIEPQGRVIRTASGRKVTVK